ncbi:MAG: hypothetical protein QG607_32 [Patescibacteria group bacterium]|nr:hypothetical protein [Patescibacteria group bacterium]
MSFEELSEIDDINGPPLPKGFNIIQTELANKERNLPKLLEDSKNHPSLRSRNLAQAELAKVNNEIEVLKRELEKQKSAEYEARRSRVATALKAPVAQPGSIILSGLAAQNVFDQEIADAEELRQIREREDGKSLR